MVKKSKANSLLIKSLYVFAGLFSLSGLIALFYFLWLLNTNYSIGAKVDLEKTGTAI